MESTVLNEDPFGQGRFFTPRHWLPDQIMKLSVTILFFCLLVGSCKKSGCLEEAGSMVSRTRFSGPIRVIRLYDNIHLYLKQDTATSIRVEAGLNLEPFIETSFEGTTLT